MKINLGKLFRSLFKGVDVGDVLAGVLGKLLAGQSVLPDHVEAHIPVSVNGRRWMADVVFRPADALEE